MARAETQSTSFATPGEVRIVIEIGSGSITVEATDTAETRIDVTSRRGVLEVAHVEERDGGSTIMLRSKKRSSGEHEVEISCPAGADLHVTTGSADLLTRGALAAISFQAGSGDLAFDAVAGDVSVKVGSGDVAGGTVGGSLTMYGASGDIRVSEVVGDLVAKTASGDADLTRVDGDVTITSISGDVRVGRLHAGIANIRAVSGDVEVGVAPGTRVFLDLSSTTGDARSDLTPTEGPGSGDALELHAATVSGDIRVRRARA